MGYGAEVNCELALASDDAEAPKLDVIAVDTPPVPKGLSGNEVAEIGGEIPLPEEPPPVVRLAPGKVLFDRGYGALDRSDCEGEMVDVTLPVPRAPEVALPDEFVG